MLCSAYAPRGPPITDWQAAIRPPSAVDRTWDMEFMLREKHQSSLAKSQQSSHTSNRQQQQKHVRAIEESSIRFTVRQIFIRGKEEFNNPHLGIICMTRLELFFVIGLSFERQIFLGTCSPVRNWNRKKKTGAYNNVGNVGISVLACWANDKGYFRIDKPQCINLKYNCNLFALNVEVIRRECQTQTQVYVHM